MNIKQERQFIQEMLESGKLDSLSAQVIALNIFANTIGYSSVDGDIRKGFLLPDVDHGNMHMSLVEMQSCYNHGYRNLRTSAHKIVGKKVVERISLQYNKRTNKKLTTQLEWLKFIKED